MEHQYPQLKSQLVSIRNFTDLKLLVKYILTGESSELAIFGYYTNGKIIWNNDKRYALQSVFSDRIKAYCTDYGYNRNIIVKGIYSPSLDPLELITDIDYTRSYLNERELFLNEQYGTISSKQSEEPYEAVFDEAEVFPTASSFTSPCTHMMCFLSNEDYDNPDIIKSFYGCVLPEEVAQIAEDSRMEYSLTENEFNKFIVFSKVPGNIQPLFWLDMRRDQRTIGNVVIKLKERFIGSRVYVLLIDIARERGEYTNLDVKNILFRGSHLSLPNKAP